MAGTRCLKTCVCEMSVPAECAGADDIALVVGAGTLVWEGAEQLV